MTFSVFISMLESLALVLLLASSVISNPLPLTVMPGSALQAASGQPGLFICTEPFWKGTCRHYGAAEILPANPTGLGNCLPMPASSALSFDPQNGVTCSLYQNIECQTGGRLMNQGSISSPTDWLDGPTSVDLNGEPNGWKAYRCNSIPSHQSLTTAVASADMAKREPVEPLGVTICSNPDFKQPCTHHNAGRLLSIPNIPKSNYCLQLPRVSRFSFRPDAGLRCAFYHDGLCRNQHEPGRVECTDAGMQDLPGPTYKSNDAKETGWKSYACWEVDE
jgi:hypothetical protein